MSIFNYFKLKAKMNHPVERHLELPDPNGLLSSTVPPSTIVTVNKKLSSTMEKSASRDKSQGPYLHVTAEQRHLLGGLEMNMKDASRSNWDLMKVVPVAV